MMSGERHVVSSPRSLDYFLLIQADMKEMLPITGSLWEQSANDRWIPLPNNQ